MGNIDPIMVVLLFGIIYFGGVIHEIGHGWAALKSGDETAKLMGRITLNPIAHFDLFSSFIMPLALLFTFGVPFGGMKPVPVNPNNFNNFHDWRAYRKADIFVSLAGPGFQIMFALIFLIVFLLLSPLIRIDSYAFFFFYFGFFINVVIAFFNLIPIPPLDGSHVFKYFLPTELRVKYTSYGRQFGFFLLIAFVLLGGTAILGPIRSITGSFFLWAYENLSLVQFFTIS